MAAKNVLLTLVLCLAVFNTLATEPSDFYYITIHDQYVSQIKNIEQQIVCRTINQIAYNKFRMLCHAKPQLLHPAIASFERIYFPKSNLIEEYKKLEQQIPRVKSCSNLYVCLLQANFTEQQFEEEFKDSIYETKCNFTIHRKLLRCSLSRKNVKGNVSPEEWLQYKPNHPSLQCMPAICKLYPPVMDIE